MAFTYQGGANPPIDYPRLLVSDTVQFDATGRRVYAFEDSEIMSATNIEMSLWQSGMYYSGSAGAASAPSTPIPWRRIAATLLDALAANSTRIALVVGLLDVKLNAAAAKDMREQAQALREIDDNSGAFVMIEQTSNVFSFRQRYWRSVQRQSGGGAAL